VSETFEALKRAERNREQAEAAHAAAFEQLVEDISALRVTVHSLEDRVELDVGGLLDELRQALAKADELAASRSRAAEERLLMRVGWLVQASERAERRLNVLVAVMAVAALFWLLRC
jgi:hypothetical protein